MKNIIGMDTWEVGGERAETLTNSPTTTAIR